MCPFHWDVLLRAFNDQTLLSLGLQGSHSQALHLLELTKWLQQHLYLHLHRYSLLIICFLFTQDKYELLDVDRGFPPNAVAPLSNTLPFDPSEIKNDKFSKGNIYIYPIIDMMDGYSPVRESEFKKERVTL